MKTVLAVGVFAVLTTYAYAKWVRSTLAGVAEDAWHEAFDRLFN